jgi:hypothetical protein
MFNFLFLSSGSQDKTALLRFVPIKISNRTHCETEVSNVWRSNMPKKEMRACKLIYQYAFGASCLHNKSGDLRAVKR